VINALMPEVILDQPNYETTKLYSWNSLTPI